MERVDKIKLAIKKGITYDRTNGNVYGVKGNVITNKSNGYIAIKIWHDKKRLYLYAHQFAWYIEHNEVVKVLDHKNRIKTDNRISNLRVGTKQINALNTNAKGCSFDKRAQKWEAYIHINGRKRFLGYYAFEHEAKTVYQKEKQRVINNLINKE